jgi:cytochrome P450
MALATAQTVLAMILRRFEIRLAPGKQVEPWFALTLQPRGGMPMILTPRGG